MIDAQNAKLWSQFFMFYKTTQLNWDKAIIEASKDL